jgi:hypothetical protein
MNCAHNFRATIRTMAADCGVKARIAHDGIEMIVRKITFSPESGAQNLNRFSQMAMSVRTRARPEWSHRKE